MNTEQAARSSCDVPARARPGLPVRRGARRRRLPRALALDSLDFLQLVELLSERTGVRIDEDDYPKLATLASGATFLAGS